MASSEKSHNPFGKLLVLVPIILAIVMCGILLRQFFAPPAALTHATVLPAPMALPDFTLMDQNDQLFDKRSLNGRWSMVFFGFTQCPDICPVTLQQLALARRQLAEENSDAVLPDIIFVSVDPERDSPEVLRQYVQAFGAGITGVSGDPAEISKLARTLGIFFEVDPGEGDDYTVAHSAAVIVINENAEFHALFSAPHNVSAFVVDMPVIIAAK